MTPASQTVAKRSVKAASSTSLRVSSKQKQHLHNLTIASLSDEHVSAPDVCNASVSQVVANKPVKGVSSPLDVRKQTVRNKKMRSLKKRSQKEYDMGYCDIPWCSTVRYIVNDSLYILVNFDNFLTA